VKATLFSSDISVGAVVRTSAEKKKAQEIKKMSKGLKALFTTRFVITLVINIILSAICVYLVIQLSQKGEIHSFDPYEILSVSRGDDTKVIKKAYKKLSLLYHPDKCLLHHPEEFCTDKFMSVKRAAEALTDPVAKDNWEKYGNPDGKQSLEVSIGLPTLLLDKANRNVILLTYLIIMVVVIPLAVYKYYSDSSQYGENNVMYDTYSWFYHSLSEHVLVKTLPEVLAGSAEFRERNLPKTPTERQEVKKVMEKVKSHMQKPKVNHPVLLKGNVILHSHLCNQTDALSPESKEDLNYMLRYSNSLTEAMIGVCKHNDWLQSAINCVQFGQYIAQGLWTKDSTLLQLPHFTETEVKLCDKAEEPIKTIKQFMELSDEEKDQTAMLKFTDEQKQDVIKCCSILPDIEVTTKVFVDDDEDGQIYEGDLTTVQVTLTRNNLKEGKRAGLVHAPGFPFPKQEAWWIILGTKGSNIINIAKVIDPKRVVDHKIKFLAPKEGTYEFDLWILSNAYLGLDQKLAVELKTLDAAALPEYKIHPDDAALDDEPTLFEEMLNANVEEDSDSEEEDSDDESEEEGIKELSPAEAKKLELKNARRKAAAAGGDDDDSDSDSEVEEVFEEK
jgi:translocation protein SEC63